MEKNREGRMSPDIRDIVSDFINTALSVDTFGDFRDNVPEIGPEGYVR